jgi:hypothetical protein
MSLGADVASYITTLFNESRDFLKNFTSLRLVIAGTLLAIGGGGAYYGFDPNLWNLWLQASLILLATSFLFVFLFVSPFRIWRRREAKLPQVEIVFDAPKPPYLQELVLSSGVDLDLPEVELASKGVEMK